MILVGTVGGPRILLLSCLCPLLPNPGPDDAEASPRKPAGPPRCSASFLRMLKRITRKEIDTLNSHAYPYTPRIEAPVLFPCRAPV